MSEHNSTHAPQDENQQITKRREKLQAIRQRQSEGKGAAFPNDFKPSDHAADLFAAHAGQTPEGLLEQGSVAKVAGRMMLKRVMGKASFATLQDSSGRIQIYIKGEDVGDEVYARADDFRIGTFAEFIPVKDVYVAGRLGAHPPPGGKRRRFFYPQHLPIEPCAGTGMGRCTGSDDVEERGDGRPRTD